MYAVIFVQIEWEDYENRQLPIPRGLRHGCPLSPLVCMLYGPPLDEALEQSEKGVYL